MSISRRTNIHTMENLVARVAVEKKWGTYMLLRSNLQDILFSGEKKKREKYLKYTLDDNSEALTYTHNRMCAHLYFNKSKE